MTAVVTTGHRDKLRFTPTRYGDYGGRWYRLDGDEHLSVTNVLDNAWSKAPLLWWSAAEATAEAIRRSSDLARLANGHDPDQLADETYALVKAKKDGPGTDLFRDIRKAFTSARQKAMDRGSEAHDLIEQHLLGFDPDPRGNPYYTQFLNFEADVKPRWRAAEAVVGHSKHRYAGTLDALADINDAATVIDFKTRLDTRVFDNMAVQVSAIANCDRIEDPDNGPDQWGRTTEFMGAARGAVVVLTPTAWKYQPVRVDDATFIPFRAALALRRFQLDGEWKEGAA